MRQRTGWWRYCWKATWRSTLGGAAFWLLAVVVILASVAGEVAPLLRSGRHQLTATFSQLDPPRANTEDLAPVVHTSGNPFGLNTFLYQEVEEAKIRRSLDIIRAAGIGLIREQVPWQEFERGRKGNFWDERWQRESWHNLDRLVGLVEEYGLELIARVDYPPDWALAAGTQWHASPPARLDDYGDFVHALASRYRGRIKYYQVWNEPNLTIEWGMRPVNAAEYVALLRAAYPRIKEADPEAVVIAAALAPTIEMGPQNLSDLEYLRQMYEAGGREFFDIVSVNPYGLRSGPDDRRFTSQDSNFSRPIQAREIMVRFGDTSKPIWASETGWNALPPEYPRPPAYGRTTLTQQSAYTVRGYERMLQEWPWLGAVMLWHLRMVDNRLAVQQAYYFGALGDDFAPNPVFSGLARLSSGEALAYPGFRQEDHWALGLVGSWAWQRDSRAAAGGYALSFNAGSKVQLRFWGTDLDLVVVRGPQSGSVRVTVDGSAPAANALPQSDGGAVVDLRQNDEEWQARLAVSRGLPLGEHTLELELVSEGKTVLFDGVIVQARGGKANPLPLTLGLLMGLALFVIWARSQSRRDR
ncbi:MAG: hypothetical protein ACYC4L_02830 [Chloroflexota bacterium]